MRGDNRLSPEKNRREENKKRARKMVLVLGIVSVVLILAMMVEIYL